MKYFVFLLFTTLALASCTETRQVSAGNTTRVSGNSSIENEVFDLVNKYRRSKGLPVLSLNSAVTTVARKHSQDMADKTVAFGHAGFDARRRTLESKLPGMRAAAENVASGQRSAAEVVEDWIKSPGHKVNIEGNYTHTGIGIAADKKGVLYYTQIFTR